MLLKLLKYEFKSTYLKFLSAFAVYIVMLAVLLIFFRNHLAITFCMVVFGVIALFVITFLELFQRYNNNLYGSEGYLMFTLPVSSRMLLLSKLITAFVWIMALVTVYVATIFVVTYRFGQIPSINKVFEEIWKERAVLPPYISSVFVSIITTAISIYLSITVSKLSIWRRVGVLMGFVTYFVINAVMSLPAYLFGLVETTFHVTNADVGSKMLLNLTPIFNNNMTFFWLDIVFDCLMCVAMFFITSYLMEKKTNLK